VLADAESERILLQKARRALQAELESMDTVDANNKISSGRGLPENFSSRKQDLERSLEEQGDRVDHGV